MKKQIILLISILAVALFSSQSFAGEIVKAASTYTATQLIGLEVDNLEGKHLGIIRDINLAAATGEINYVVLGKSMLGIGEDTRVAVPLEALEIKNIDGGLTATFNVSEPKLISGPKIIPGESVEDFKDRLQKYYR